jgi:hypothetical protein
MTSEPIIVRRRAAARTSRICENNFVASSGPARGNRKGAGARQGNANALKHGYSTAARIARRRELAALLRDARALVARAKREMAR